MIYKVTAPYDQAAERGVIWNDPDLAIPWPIAPERGAAVRQGHGAAAAGGLSGLVLGLTWWRAQRWQSTAPILVTGGTGQLASALAAAAARGRVRPRRPAGIRLRPAGDHRRGLSRGRPVAGGERRRLHRGGRGRGRRRGGVSRQPRRPGGLARLCAAAGIPLIHISTDYVFDGAKGAPYVETDPVAPQGVYGASKLAGEHEVLARCPRTIVLRTSWVYAPTGKNFVRTMLRVGAERDRLRVVADQRGCPTTAADLADGDPGDRRAPARGLAGQLMPASSTPPAPAGPPGTASRSRRSRKPRGSARAVPRGRADHHRRLSDHGEAPGRLAAGLQQAAATFGVRLPDWRPSLARTIDAIFAAI